MITHSLLDIATATRIESMAKTMSVSSTFTTVAQKADRPSQGRAWRRRRFCPASGFSGSARTAGTAGRRADQLHPPDVDQVGREQRSRGRERRTRRGCRSAAPSAAPPRQAQHQDGQDQGVVGAEQALEQDQQPDGDEVGEMEVHDQSPSILRKPAVRHAPAGAADAAAESAGPSQGLDTTRIKAHTWIDAA